MRENGARGLAVARRYASCAADADDAYQRALEKFFCHGAEVDADCRLAWFLTVVRNEALMLNRGRAKFSNDQFERIVDSLVCETPPPDEMIAANETMFHGREALRRIKPDQLRCLLLRAADLDYDAIGRVTGFSYAKVNRCLSEGRAALRDRYERVESGVECRRIESALSQLADGVLVEERLAEVELHVEGCVGCQATLRHYRESSHKLAALFPVAVLAKLSLVSRAGDQLAGLANSLQERVAGLGPAGHQGSELALTKKAVIVAAASATVFAGGVSVERAIDNATGEDRAAAPVSPALPTETAGVLPAPTAQTADPGGADAEKERKPPREPRDSDVIDRQNGVPASADGGDEPFVDGTSAAPEESYGSPPEQSWSDSASPQSDPSGEFAP